MRKRRSMEFLLFISLFLFNFNVFSAPVPDTGQAKCFDDAGKQIAPCPSSGDRFYGQDANYDIYPMTYTKLDATGKALADSASVWAMVKDDVTGLIWEMKTNLDGAKNYDDPHDADNSYTWYDSRPALNGGNPGMQGDGTDTEDFLDALNKANFGGYNDWRLPTIKELAYIVDYSVPYPVVMIAGDFFPNTVADEFWSSTTLVGAATNAWSMNFQHGNVNKPNKVSAFHVRAVRGGQTGASAEVRPNDVVNETAGEAFTDNGDGTVTDTSTGLMWQQDGSAVNTWGQALSYCVGLKLGGHDDWRLPNKKEMRSLADHSRYNPAILTTAFPQTIASGYWSSTTYEEKPGMAWGVEFYSGNDFWSDKSKSFNIRAVRGGKTGPLERPVLSVSPVFQNVTNHAVV